MQPSGGPSLFLWVSVANVPSGSSSASAALPAPWLKCLSQASGHAGGAEDWHAEMWLDDADNIALYARVRRTLRESAEYGSDAHNVINAARRALKPS